MDFLRFSAMPTMAVFFVRRDLLVARGPCERACAEACVRGLCGPFASQAWNNACVSKSALCDMCFRPIAPHAACAGLVMVFASFLISKLRSTFCPSPY